MNKQSKKQLTVGDLLADERPPLAVILLSTWQRVHLHPALVKHISADAVKILVPGLGFGLVVPINPSAN